MKKLICTLLSVVMLAAIPVSMAGCGTPRDELLKLYMPGEYIDEARKDAIVSSFIKRVESLKKLAGHSRVVDDKKDDVTENVSANYNERFY